MRLASTKPLSLSEEAQLQIENSKSSSQPRAQAHGANEWLESAPKTLTNRPVRLQLHLVLGHYRALSEAAVQVVESARQHPIGGCCSIQSRRGKVPGVTVRVTSS